MKTISDVVQMYNNLIESSRTRLHGFKVGDKVKYAPHAVEIYKSDMCGEIINIGGITLDPTIVIVEKERKGSYNLEKIDEFYLMPND